MDTMTSLSAAYALFLKLAGRVIGSTPTRGNGDGPRESASPSTVTLPESPLPAIMATRTHAGIHYSSDGAARKVTSRDPRAYGVSRRSSSAALGPACRHRPRPHGSQDEQSQTHDREVHERGHQ